MAYISGPSYDPKAAADQWGFVSDWGNYLSKHRDRTQADKMRAWRNQLAMEAAERAKQEHAITQRIRQEQLNKYQREAEDHARMTKHRTSDPAKLAATERMSQGLPAHLPAGEHTGMPGMGPEGTLRAASVATAPTEQEQEKAKFKLAMQLDPETAANLLRNQRRWNAIDQNQRQAIAAGNAEEAARLARQKAEIEIEISESKNRINKLKEERIGKLGDLEQQIFGGQKWSFSGEGEGAIQTQIQAADPSTPKYRELLRKYMMLGGIDSSRYKVLIEDSLKLEKKKQGLSPLTPEQKQERDLNILFGQRGVPSEYQAREEFGENPDQNFYIANPTMRAYKDAYGGLVASGYNFSKHQEKAMEDANKKFGIADSVQPGWQELDKLISASGYSRIQLGEELAKHMQKVANTSDEFTSDEQVVASENILEALLQLHRADPKKDWLSMYREIKSDKENYIRNEKSTHFGFTDNNWRPLTTEEITLLMLLKESKRRNDPQYESDKERFKDTFEWIPKWA